MATLDKAYFDDQLEKTSDAILSVVKHGFDGVDHSFHAVHAELVDLRGQIVDLAKRMEGVERNLTSLTTSVDRFSKIFTDLNQEVIVLRKQLQDAEQRIGQLEFKPSSR